MPVRRCNLYMGAFKVQISFSKTVQNARFNVNNPDNMGKKI